MADGLRKVCLPFQNNNSKMCTSMIFVITFTVELPTKVTFWMLMIIGVHCKSRTASICVRQKDALP